MLLRGFSILSFSVWHFFIVQVGKPALWFLDVSRRQRGAKTSQNSSRSFVVAGGGHGDNRQGDLEPGTMAKRKVVTQDEVAKANAAVKNHEVALDQFPSELLEVILSQVPITDLMHSAALVCTKWAQVKPVYL